VEVFKTIISIKSCTAFVNNILFQIYSSVTCTVEEFRKWVGIWRFYARDCFQLTAMKTYAD